MRRCRFGARCATSMLAALCTQSLMQRESVCAALARLHRELNLIIGNR
jgi:hypothetical protein